MRLAAVLGALLASGILIATMSHRAPAETKVSTVKVEGLFCKTCELPVKKAVETLEGVSDVNVSWQDGGAEVTYDPAKVTPESIVAAINEQTRFKAAVATPEP